MNYEKKKIPVYYFTGTGNSMFIARNVAREINGEAVNIVRLMKEDEIVVEIDSLGFCFPIYDFKPAQIMLDFIKKIKNLENKYIFAFGTYGIAPSKAIELFSDKIEEAGGKLSLGIAVHMPHNRIASGIFSDKQHKDMFDKWENIRNGVVEEIKSTKFRTPDKSKPGELIKKYIFHGTLFKMIPTLSKLIFYVTFHGGWKALAFKTNEECNGCGICEKICPANNIKLSNGKPIWGEKCVGCFACIQWCPQNAITLGPDLKIKKYHHPEIELSDMIESGKGNQITENRK